jgi:hypothetical protein
MVIALMLQVTLVFQDSLPIADPIVRTAVQEAAAIWAPYGLALNRAPAACDRAPSDTLLLAVDAAERVSPGRVGVVLGEVAFRPDGMPEPRVSLFLNALLALVADTRALSLAALQSPRVLHDLIVGRAVGRVLAHEIGHYILATRAHGPAGLMRSWQRSDELVAPSRAGFKLSAVEAARILAR